jgi:NAD(P)H-hydrate epimerase
MNGLPRNLYRAEHVRELDRIAIEEYHIPGIKLMERAGSAAFTVLHTQWPRAKRIAVLCGIGNNGGDGYIVARLADSAGIRAHVYQLGDQSRLRGDALTAFERLEGSHVDVLAFDPDAHSFEMYDVVVDAMLGTGLQGDVQSHWADAIDLVNTARHQGAEVLAIDIPSGLHADTGRVLAKAVCADATVTFIGLKQGMFTASGPDYCGEIHFNALQVPPEIYEKVPIDCERTNASQWTQALSPRSRATHKNQCGHVLLVGGNFGMAGAIRMAAEAAGRSGAGLISVATRAEHVASVNIARPELMVRGIREAREIKPLLDKATVVAIGPGLGQDDWAKGLFASVIQSNLPMVVDADALNLLALQVQTRANWVLTPHPGEAARLLDCDLVRVSGDRFWAVKEIQERFGGVCVLKGCGSLISPAHEKIYLCDAGNPGMASGGMGDVLTGVIAGLLAQGLSLDEAAVCGACVHAEAGDRAAKNGERGMLATDLLPHIRHLVNPV